MIEKKEDDEGVNEIKTDSFFARKVNTHVNHGKGEIWMLRVK
jgi:hypothetical protein